MNKFCARATLTHFSCSPNFPPASITRYTHAKHEQILNWFSSSASAGDLKFGFHQELEIDVVATEIGALFLLQYYIALLIATLTSTLSLMKSSPNA